MLERLNPRTELDRMLDEVDRLLSDTMGRTRLLPRLRGLRPAIDLYETADAVILKAVIPGAKLDDIDVALAEGVLTLRGHTGYALGEQEEGHVTWYRRDIVSGPFVERISLPVPIEEDQVSATFDDAILTLTMPKAEHVRVKRIPLRSTSSAPGT